MVQREQVSGDMEGGSRSLLSSQLYWYSGDWFGVLFSGPDDVNKSDTDQITDV